MTRGMYAAAGGMICGLRAGDILSNNLANVSTPGFRADRTTFGSFQKVLLPQIKAADGSQASIAQSTTVNPTEVDMTQGALQTTGNKMDLAVEGRGWFVLQTPAGERYTRDGHFNLLGDGTLVNQDGLPVMGLNGTIRLPSDATVNVDEQGQVMNGTRVVGKLRLVQLTTPASIVKEGGNLVSGGGPVQDLGSTIRQGMLESSNADSMRAMVDLMHNLRFVEMNQRVIQAQDSTLQQVLDVARK